MSDELIELQREWRQSVSASIKSTEEKTDLILAQLNNMRMEYAQQSALDKVSIRVGNLESDRAKLVGAAVILNAVGAFVIYIITKLWR